MAQHSVNNQNSSYATRFLNAVELGYLRCVSHENKRPFFIATGLLCIALFFIVLFSSKKIENEAIASYKTSQILDELVLQSDKSSIDSLQSLVVLAHESKSAFKKAAGTIALSLLANGHQQSPLFKKCLTSSSDYFEQLKMGDWSGYIQQLHNNSPHQNVIESKKGDFFSFCTDAASQKLDSQEKVARVKQFFEKYPGFTAQLEMVWGQKIQRFYEFIEDQNGQYSSLSIKD